MDWTPQHTAGLVLTAFAVVVFVRLAMWMARSPFPYRYQLPLFFVNQLLTRVLWRTTVEGHFQLARERGAVIIANHRSSVDPCFIQVVLPRLVHWFVAKEYFGLPLVGRFLKRLLTIPTNRGGTDIAATRKAIRYAQEGSLVGVLPEGRINENDELLLPGRPGAALIALRANVPIVPCYIEGAPYNGTFWGCLFMVARVRVVIGEPIDLSRYQGADFTPELLKDVTISLLKSIATLAGHAEYQPAVAGRRWKPQNDNS
ncbi:MAG: lysophospholipid acyltransferase family protein [Pirellulales bacterium]